MSKQSLSAKDKRFYAFMAAIAAGCIAFVVSAVVGARAFATYCESTEYDFEDET